MKEQNGRQDIGEVTGAYNAVVDQVNELLKLGLLKLTRARLFGKDDGEFETRRYDDNEADKQAFLACLTLKNRLKQLDSLAA